MVAPALLSAPGPLAARWQALGTYVHLGVREAALLEPASQIAHDLLDEVDRALSRFRPDSELSAANGRAGRRTPAGPVLVAAVEAARHAAEQTDGLVTPLLGRTLVQLGYDRDFALLREDPGGSTDVPAPALDAWRSLEVGPDWVRVPDGTALDLGSVGKAWASDLIAATLAARLDGAEAVVSLGGDVAIAGGGAWPVDLLASPGDTEPDEVVWVEGGGLATSSTSVRRWRRGGTERHHVVDPRTGQPAEEVWRTVTATGPTCSAANAAATCAVVLGAEAPAWLAARGIDARLVRSDGAVVRAGRWPAAIDREPRG